MFILGIKSVLSVNSVTRVGTSSSVIDRIKKMTRDEKQPNGIHFLSYSVLLFKDLELNKDCDDDSNISDDNFVPDDEHK